MNLRTDLSALLASNEFTLLPHSPLSFLRLLPQTRQTDMWMGRIENETQAPVRIRSRLPCVDLGLRAQSDASRTKGRAGVASGQSAVDEPPPPNFSFKLLSEEALQQKSERRKERIGLN